MSEEKDGAAKKERRSLFHDAELKGINKIVGALEALDDTTKQRVLDYLRDRYFKA